MAALPQTVQDYLQAAWDSMIPRARRDLLDEFASEPSLDWQDKTSAALGFVGQFSDLPPSIQGALTLAYSVDGPDRFSVDRFRRVRAEMAREAR